MAWEYYTFDSKKFMTDDTKCVHLEDFKRLNITKDELAYILHVGKELIEKRENWYSYDGDMWYLKQRCNMRIIINELLGEYLSTYMDLPTIHYILLVSNGKIDGVASKNFRDKGISYIQANKLSDRQHKNINRVLLSRPTIFNREYKKQMYNYLMRNYYANQGDRMHNVLCEYRFKKIYLSALYDYEMSFANPSEDRILDPYFLGLDIVPHLLKELVKRDNAMQDSVNKILELSMNVALESIEDDNKIKIPEDLKKYYLDYDSSRKEKILSIIG